ncbi:hypothetical protein P4575_27170 [Priestia megaterium]|uniref:hypothetical protein n=1 Tax=Priestia megaterium TaxID=1404 RepID=UPI002E2392D9|nr:hypothetical protein [Priestia megaterium]
MEIYNVTVKKTLVGEKEELLLYSNEHQIQIDDFTDEEIGLLEEIVQRYRNKHSVGRSEYCRRFILSNAEEAKEISSNLKDKNINSIVEHNVVTVQGVQNYTIATAYITEYKARKDANSK